MVKVGKTYDLNMCEPRHDGFDSVKYPLWTVKEIDGPVVTFVRDGEEWTINLASPLFGYASEPGS